MVVKTVRFDMVIDAVGWRDHKQQVKQLIWIHDV